MLVSGMGTGRRPSSEEGRGQRSSSVEVDGLVNSGRRIDLRYSVSSEAYRRY